MTASVRDRLRMFRDFMGRLSQSDLAARAGISRPTYQNYEEKSPPPADKLADLARAWGISADWLLFPEEPEQWNYRIRLLRPDLWQTARKGGFSARTYSLQAAKVLGWLKTKDPDLWTDDFMARVLGIHVPDLPTVLAPALKDATAPGVIARLADITTLPEMWLLTMEAKYLEPLSPEDMGTWGHVVRSCKDRGIDPQALLDNIEFLARLKRRT